MNQVALIQEASLPMLIDRATLALSSARNSAEVLEARDMARVAYDAAKSAGRMAKGKAAYDEVIGAVYRAQADALLIEARAKTRLADEYDAAQARGEVKANGGDRSSVVDHNTASAADLGIRRDEIHEGRKLRDAEAVDPGATERALNDMLERGEEPTKAKLRRELIGDRPSTPKPSDDDKLRDEFHAMSRDGQEQDWIGLRGENAELRARVAKQTSMIADLKSQIKDLTERDDAGRTIGNLQRRLAQSEGRSKEHQASAARLQRTVNAQKAEIDRLKKQAENQEIEL